MHPTPVYWLVAVAFLHLQIGSAAGARWRAEQSEPVTLEPYITGAQVIDDSSLNSYVISSFHGPVTDGVQTNGFSIRKYDSARQLLWERQLANEGIFDSPYFRSVTPQGHLLLGGASDQVLPSLLRHGLVVWVRADGSQMFTNRFVIDQRPTVVYALAGDFEGNIAAIVNTFEFLPGGLLTTRRVIKLTPDGTILWQRDLPMAPRGFTESSFPPQLVFDSTNNLYVSVSAGQSVAVGPTLIHTIKFDRHGFPLWSADVRQKQYTFPQAILVDRHTNVLISTFSWNTGTNVYHASWTLVSYDAEGALRWQRSIANGSARSLFNLVGPQALAVDEANSIYLCTTRVQPAHPNRGIAGVTTVSPTGRIRSRKRLSLPTHPYFESPIAFTTASTQGLTLRYHVMEEHDEDPPTVDWLATTFSFERRSSGR